MKPIVAVCLSFILVACSHQTSQTLREEFTGSQFIGQVLRTQGFPALIRTGQTRVLSQADQIAIGDLIRTDPNSKLILQLADGTTMNIGPGSEFKINTFQYRSIGGKTRANFDLQTGSLRTLTGSVMASKKPLFEINTPRATIGVRGTDFWGGFSFDSEVLDVAMISGKGIYIYNDLGRVEISEPGFGTSVGPEQQPSKAKLWPRKKLARAAEETAI